MAYDKERFGEFTVTHYIGQTPVMKARGNGNLPLYVSEHGQILVPNAKQGRGLLTLAEREAAGRERISLDAKGLLLCLNALEEGHASNWTTVAAKQNDGRVCYSWVDEEGNTQRRLFRMPEEFVLEAEIDLSHIAPVQAKEPERTGEREATPIDAPEGAAVGPTG